MKRFAGIGLTAATFAQAASTGSVTLSVHLLTACSGTATTKVKVAAAAACLDPKPFLTQQDVRSAELHKNAKGNPLIFLTFRNEAAMLELKITRQNIGKPVAILLNGRVVSVPVISAASRFLYIDANLKQDQAALLVEALNRQAGNR